jgi:hypothetical protein
MKFTAAGKERRGGPTLQVRIEVGIHLHGTKADSSKDQEPLALIFMSD